MEQNNKFDITQMKMERTTQGFVLETVFTVVALLTWAYTLWRIHLAPSLVPTRLDLSGHVTAMGSPLVVIIPCCLCTVIGWWYMHSVYSPRLFRHTCPRLTNRRQAELYALCARVSGIMIQLLGLVIAYSIVGRSVPSPIPVLVAMGIIGVVIAVFMILIHKTR